MARLSIVIPYAGNVQKLENSLVSVLENRPEDCEVLVVLSDTYEDPYDLEDEVTFVYAPKGTDPVRCLNLGIDASSAPLLHTLWPGMQVEAGWAEQAIGHFADPEVMAVAPLLLSSEPSEAIVAAGIEYGMSGAVRFRSRGRAAESVGEEPFDVLGPIPQAGFYRKSIVQDLKRFDTRLNLLAAGVHLALAIEWLGGRAVVEPECRVLTEAGSFETAGVFRTARDAERLFWRWAPRCGWMAGSVGHLGQVFLDCFGRFPRPSMVAEILGRLVGLTSVGAHRKQHCQLARIEANRRAAAIDAPHFLKAKRGFFEKKGPVPLRRAG